MRALSTPRSQPRVFFVVGGELVRHRVIQPTSTSVFGSSLYARDDAVSIESRHLALRSLQEDAAKQKLKYRGFEPAEEHAPFNIPLPQMPQNSKFSWRSTSSRVSTSASSQRLLSPSSPLPPSPLTPSSQSSSILDTCRSKLSTLNAAEKKFVGLDRVRLNKESLRRWFEAVDRSGDGKLSRRELIVALTTDPQMLSTLCCLSPETSTTDAAESDLMGSRRAAINMIKDLWAKNGLETESLMDWEKFVNFFRQAGILLEYRTRPDLNRTPRCRNL